VANKDLSLKTKAAVMIEGMNRMGYDAMALGEADFQIGLEELKKRIAEAHFPILSANVVMTGTRQTFVQPYVVKSVGDREVGIVGLTTLVAQGMVRMAAGDALQVLDPFEVARQVIPEVRKQVDILIVLSNMGFEEDQRLATEVPGIDLIVGGRSRMILPPVEAGQTVIAQAGHSGEWLGLVTLTFDASGRRTGLAGESINLGPEFPDDPDIRAWLDTYTTK